MLESDLEAYLRESGMASVLAKRRNAAEAARLIAVARQKDGTPIPGVDPGVLPGNLQKLADLARAVRAEMQQKAKWGRRVLTMGAFARG